MRVRKNIRIVGAERQALAAAVSKKYAAGGSVREIAESINRSYGFVHRLLEETGVTLRPRGGNHRPAQTH
ncbi:helix-turn-helix domain-containing protein [Nonomuraea basaltis]|uniref:helix-turn-helix domain-containing protein n=1 Tax=Nonomuraea basaltis TaxID=2495887 RepID=UPI00110C5867|nr:helix-turn-helix domain-containing protein [Nonomuraea basaltis]TMR99536.1 transcriptional regulator [Nonomuraea basaltis]